MNLHIHPVTLDHASRVLKCLESAGRSGCFQRRVFIGAGPAREYQLQDSAGVVRVHLFARGNVRGRGFLRKSLATLLWTRRARAFAKVLSPKCINVHGLSTLGLGVALKRRHHCRLIYDTHELETKTLAVHGVRRIYSETLERRLIAYCDAVVCVSDGIADWYASRYGIPRPLVVRNVPDRRSQRTPEESFDLRARLGVPSDGVLFVYQGTLSRGRQLELFLEAFQRVSPQRHLLFMGAGPLEEAVRRASAAHAHIHYHPAVSPHEVLAYTTQADVGLVGLENNCLNHRFSLPNKLFEYLAAGIPVITPGFPEMRRLVERFGCGWSWSGTAEALAQFAERLSSTEIRTAKEGAKAAGVELCWQEEEKPLLKLYQRLLADEGRSQTELRESYARQLAQRI